MIQNIKLGIVTVWDERGAGYVSRHYYQYLSEFFNVFIYNRGYSKNKFPNLDYIYNAQKIDSLKPMSINKKEFKEWIDKNGIEIILFNEQQSWEPVLWCKEWKIKTIAYVDYYTEKTIKLHDAYDLLLCNTKRHFEAFKNHKNVKYFKWGTDLDLFKPVKVNNSIPTFFHSCGYSPGRKGTDLVLKAFNDIKYNFKLIIHTQINLKKYDISLEPLIENLTKSKKLSIINKTVPAPGLYHLADYYVYPTRLEGIGLTILESLSSGLIPILPDFPPMNEFVSKNHPYKISINKLYAREDGYFWPQVEVCDKSFHELLIKAIKSFPNNELKSEMREWSKKNFNFKTNFIGLDKAIKDLSFGSLEYDTKIAINEFESNRPINHRLLNRINNFIYKIGYKIFK